MRTDVRDLPRLWPLRLRRNAVIDADAEPYRRLRDGLAQLNAELVGRERAPPAVGRSRPA